MKRYASQTVNGGSTVILDHLDEAIAVGLKDAEATADRCACRSPSDSVECGTIKRNTTCKHCGDARADHEVKEVDKVKTYFCKGEKNVAKRKKFEEEAAPGTTATWGELTEQYKRMLARYKECATAITKGDPEFKEDVSKIMDELRDLALEIAPTLCSNYAGFNRADEGVDVSPDLLAAGEELCCFKRKQGAGDVKQGQGDGAYRIILSTDVEWFGSPKDNAALVGALVVLLQQFKPVEVWVQQGWLGQSWGDGVTLFKLDFAGAFDPTQLAFWCGNRDKDSIFSYFVNRGLGRHETHSATTAELDCDIFLRGDWLKVMGIDGYKFCTLMHTERIDLMSRWIANTAIRIVFNDTGQDPVIEG